MPPPNKYNLVRPCADCPFRSDKPFYLPAERIQEIRESTDVFPFSCHNTVDYGDEDDDQGDEGGQADRSHCAGALILREKLGQSSIVMRLAHRLGLYAPERLEMDAPVYDTWDAMIEGCTRLTAPARGIR